MNVGKTLFAQMMKFISWTRFSRIMQRRRGDLGVRRLNCAAQFQGMVFVEITRGHSSPCSHGFGPVHPVRQS